MGLIDSDWDQAIHDESCRINKKRIKKIELLKRFGDYFNKDNTKYDTRITQRDIDDFIDYEILKSDK